MTRKSYVLRTRYGPLAIEPTGLRSCSVRSRDEKGEIQVLTIRSIPISIGHCFLVFEDGEWRTSYVEGTKRQTLWSITRRDDAAKLDATEATVPQIRDAKNAVLEAVTEWAEENRQAFIEAEREALEEKVSEWREEVAQTRRNLAAEEAALHRGIAKLAAFNEEHSEPTILP